MMEIVQTINNCFAKTHPVIGDHHQCATGELYRTYAIATPSYDESVEMLLNTFRVLGGNCAPEKPQGTPIIIDKPRKKYLYWRTYPVIHEVVQTFGELLKEEIPNGYFVIYCRACVSERWVEEGQKL